MIGDYKSYTLAASVVLFAVMAVCPLQATAAPDSTLNTSYFFDSNYQNFTLVVCGSTAQTEGCYGSARLGPFGSVGALIEGNPSVNLKTSTSRVTFT